MKIFTTLVNGAIGVTLCFLVFWLGVIIYDAFRDDWKGTSIWFGKAAILLALCYAVGLAMSQHMEWT